MSFQRPLTGESTMIATVNLNTNISSSTVSTINLSATNASITNLTANTFTYGNISTPNVIATNAYFSNLNTCNYNVCSVSTSSIYSSNASFTNVSIATKLTVPNISSLRNVFSDQVIGIYSSGGVSIRDNNQSNPAVLALYYASTAVIDTYGMVMETGKSGTGGYSKITTGQNLSFQVYADNVKQLENTSTAGWTFYTSVNTSRANICNLSSNAITTNTLGVSTLSASSLGISSLNVCSMYATAINDVMEITSGYNLCVFSNNFVVRDTANGSTHMLLDYDDATFTEVTGMEFVTGIYGANISVKGSLPLTILNNGVSQMTNVSTVGFSFFRPVYVSQIYTSNLSAKNITCNTLFQYTSGYGDYHNTVQSYAFYSSAQWMSASAITGVSAIYTCIYCSNLSVSNLSATNFAVTNLTVDDAINANRLYASNVYSSNMSVGNRIDANRVVLTLSLDAPISNVSDSRVSIVKGVSASFSYIDVSTINVPSMITTNFSVSNLSASYLTSTSTFFTDMYATNIVTTGIVSTSYFSSKQANISNLSVNNLTGTYTSVTDITVGNELYYKAGPSVAYESYATNGALTGAVFYNTLDTATARHRFQYMGDDLLSINNSRITAYKDLYSASSLFVSAANICNFSVSNLSVTTLSTATFNPANISVTNLSVTTAMTATSATIPTLYGTSFFVSNLSTSNISVTGRVTTTNICVTSISATGRITVDNIRSTLDVISTTGNISGQALFGGTVNVSNAYVSWAVSCASVSSSQVSSTSMATSWINASNASATNASLTTVTGTTVRFTNGNFSTLAVSNAVVNMCVSSLYSSSLTMATNGTTSMFGQMFYSTGRCNLFSIAPSAPTLSLGNTATIRFEISPNGVSCYDNYYASDIYTSRLYVSTFSPATVTTTTVNASNGNFSTVNAPTGNFSTLNASTFNLPSTISFSTVNASTLNGSTINGTTINGTTINSSTINASNIYSNNISDVNRIDSAGPLIINNDAIYMNSAYASTGGIPYFQMNYWKNSISAPDQGFTMYADDTRGSVMDGGNLPFTIRSSDIVQSTNTSTAGWRFYNVINTSYQNNFSKLAVSNLSAVNLTINSLSTSSLNTSSIIYTSADAVYTYSANISTVNLSSTSMTGAFYGTLNNTLACVSTSLPLTLHSNTDNTFGSGIRVPNYIDGVDLGSGFTIGYNQTTGFVNVCRSTRFYGNVLTDGNVNTITNTATLGIGQNITSGNIKIGSTTMTGNISIDTTGDVVFGCDRRSTWNTSGLLASSTQLGSFYRQFTAQNQTKTSSGQSFVFSPNNANTSLTTVPVGLYLVTANAYIRTNGGYNSNLTLFNMGTVVQNAYNFTTAGTRQFHATQANINTSGTTDFTLAQSFSGLVNVTTTGNYIGAFTSITAVQAATVGSIYHELSQVTVVKIA